MKINKNTFYLFILLAIIQLSVPLYMIWHWEDVLRNGRQYNWVTAPVDPYDVLRGRYVDLRFKEMKVAVSDGTKLSSGQTVYALLSEDQNGYAFISGISNTRPEDNAYVKVKVTHINNDNVAHFILPFKRYYMQEYLAPAAENAYLKNAGKEGRVSVRVKDGYGVLEELYIADKTIYEYLRTEKQ